jgi:type IV secretory pathway VirB10-like protein
MTFWTQNALILIAACALSTGATAQKVYKCGNSYSQIPCQGGEALTPADTRTAAQRTEALQNQQAQSQQADVLEKARLKEEAQTRTADAANRKTAEKNVKAAQAEELARVKKAKAQADEKIVLSAPSAKPHKQSKKTKEPEFFTARKAADAKN